MRSKFQNYKALVFKLNKSKDADRVVHLLTEQGERLVAVAKGLKKATSRKAAALDLGNLVDLKTTAGGGLPIITEVNLLDSFSQLKQQLPNLMLTQLVCELIDIFAQEDQAEGGIYRNAVNLMSVQGKRPALLAAALILRLLVATGHLPHLNQDAYSGDLLQENLPVYIADGGGITQQPSNASNQELSATLYKTQRFILRSQFAEIDKIDLPLADQLQLLNMHHSWLVQILDRKLGTLGALQTVLR